MAWQESLHRLEQAIADRRDFAFDTTLGGTAIAATLRKACATHDMLMWFCGLDSPEHHLARVQFRVSRGGRNIPGTGSRANSVTLLSHLAQLQVYDNSNNAQAGTPIPNPRMLLQMEIHRIT